MADGMPTTADDDPGKKEPTPVGGRKDVESTCLCNQPQTHKYTVSVTTLPRAAHAKCVLETAPEACLRVHKDRGQWRYLPTDAASTVAPAVAPTAPPKTPLAVLAVVA